MICHFVHRGGLSARGELHKLVVQRRELVDGIEQNMTGGDGHRGGEAARNVACSAAFSIVCAAWRGQEGVGLRPERGRAGSIDAPIPYFLADSDRQVRGATVSHIFRMHDMRYRSFPFLFAVLYAMGSSGVVAGPGDTTVVQTFTFDQRAPYDARFLFPPASKRFEKILMYYKLKCNPAQTPACGEWDYLTYTHAYQNTGRMDSALLSHPNFLVNGAPRDTLQYMRTASFRYAPFFERYVTRIDSAGTITRHTPGAGATRITLAAANSEMGGRIRLMIRASEIPALRDSINGLVLEVPVAGGTLKNLTMRMKNLARIADTDTLSLADASFESVAVLYRRSTSFATAGVRSVFRSTYHSPTMEATSSSSCPGTETRGRRR